MILNQEKDGELLYEVGAAILSRGEIDRLKTRPQLKGLLSYERKELEKNPYHGNLLLLAGLAKRVRKAIAAHLLSAVEDIKPQHAE
jgi:hypothetical protein